MSDISEGDWKQALMAIVDDLDPSQYKKMLEFLTEIPKSQKTCKKEKMPQIIIEHYGLEKSISAIHRAMDLIPRRDPSVQDLLRPFVDKLRNIQKKNKDLSTRSQPYKGTNSNPWKKSISSLKSGSELQDTDCITGKVVQKSGLRTYKTQDKQKKFFFYVSVADETDSIKLMVYGKNYHQLIQAGKSYLFRKLINDDDAGVVKVTSLSTMSETSSVQVPDHIEKEAQTLIYTQSPVYPIAEAKTKTGVSVEGRVTEIDPVERVSVQNKKTKVKRQNFKLRDDTGSIRICMWDDETSQCKGLSVGDVVKVTNLKTSCYHDAVSLMSTRFTQIQQVQSVGAQQVRIHIVGIIKATQQKAHLDVEMGKQLHTYVVASRLLAKAFDLKLEGFKEKLLEELPLPADTVIQGNRIMKIKKILNLEDDQRDD